VTAVPEDRYERLLLRKKKALQARDDLIAFVEYMNPHPDTPNDVSKSEYQAMVHHKVIAAALEQVEKGLIPRLILTIPPRHGKTKLATNTFVPWYLGRNPTDHVIVATYNEKFSWDLGRQVRGLLQDPLYRHVFPHATLKQGSASVDRIELDTDGMAFFTGRGGTITGRGGMGLIIDDPLKDRAEADSKTVRERLWTWYTQVMSSRLMTKVAWIVLIQTRWHEDDLIGRITDPSNPFYNETEAERWSMVDLPALAEDNDLLGRKPGEALWPERFDVKFLESQKRTDPRGFMALYQGRPTPEDGVFFRAEMLKEYHTPAARPMNEQLRIYCSSDHAVSTDQARDKTCCIPFGVDREDNIWILPGVWWGREPTDRVVDHMCSMIRKYKPLVWFAEKGHISKSIGPFLRKRMSEWGAYAMIDEITPIGDKQSRAQSILGRMAQGKVYFPAFEPWWAEARSELLKFPNTRHDDFVDAMSMVGLGMLKHSRPKNPKKVIEVPTFGTGAWLKENAKLEKRDRDIALARQGW
jgi:predicted phage terminase large subunit-like protein